MQKNTKLGWVGLGVMGEPMCSHLLAAGYPVYVYTRSKEKAEHVIGAGANWCNEPADITVECDVIFTMVGSEQEVRDVYFSEGGLFSRPIKDKIFIDMGTTAPSLALTLTKYAVLQGAHVIDAPVSGGDVGAQNASLSIMAGGDESIIKKVSELFSYLGRVRSMGKNGNGQHTKMCNQIVVAGTMIGVCESLLYARRAGLDCEALIAAIRPGAAGCWTLDNLAPRMVEQDFSSGFMVDHFIKDLAIAVSEAEAMKLDLPGLLLARSLYDRVREMGHGRSATQALLLALDHESL